MGTSLNHPLISVLVIAYNSAKTIIETLDSIKKQTYPELELIVTDDCSSDNTIFITKKWIENNHGRFIRVKLVTSAQNTGISANYNRGEDECSGEWIKCIAGDDILLQNCIQLNMDYVMEHPDTEILFSMTEPFGGKIDHSLIAYDPFHLSPVEQLDFLINKGNFIPASTAFYKLERFRSLGIRCDERIPLLDDWPKWIVCLQKGVKFSFIEEKTVKYRLNGTSANLRWPSINYYRSLRLFELFYRYPLRCQNDYSKQVRSIVEYECAEYNRLLNAYKTPEYRLGRMLLYPLILIRRFVIILRRKLSK